MSVVVLELDLRGRKGDGVRWKNSWGRYTCAVVAVLAVGNLDKGGCGRLKPFL